MAQLMVRNLDETLVRALKKRAAQRNRSAEQVFGSSIVASY